MKAGLTRSTYGKSSSGCSALSSLDGAVGQAAAAAAAVAGSVSMSQRTAAE